MSEKSITRQQLGLALQQDSDIQPMTVAGVPGRSVALHSVSPFPAANGKPQRERDWLVTVPQSDGAVIFMICIASQSEFDRFKPT